MMDLSQHIERLLADNDCVIVPRLGGFITCDTPARWTEGEGLFLPPGRMTAFNPRLTLNDGLLVQAYMAERHLDYARASRQVHQDVDRLIAALHTYGSVTLPRIGILRLSIRNTYDFTPERPVLSSDLYGFTGFRIRKLEALSAERRPSAPIFPHRPEEERKEVPVRRPRIRIHASFWSNVAAVAAILILFFAISIPVKNTETLDGNYAQLLPTEMFAQTGVPSLATTPLSLRTPAPVKPVPAKEETPQEETSPVPAPTPVSEKEKPAPAPAPAPTPVPQTKENAPARIYHLIVASVGSESDARALAAKLVKEGHTRAQAIIGGGKMRVSIDSYASEAEAYRAVNKLRGQEAYKNAWVLKKK